MKLTTGILVAGLMTGGLWAQNPNIINNVQSTMNTVQQNKTNDSNAALGIKGAPSAQPAAKPAPGAQAKPVAAAPAKNTPASAKGMAGPVVVAAKAKAAPVAKQPAAPRVVIAAKQTAPKPVIKAAVPGPTKISAEAKAEDVTKIAEAPKPEEKKWAMSGKRDPFFSPVVQEASGSGCSTGKKCLEIGQINVRGVV